MEPTRYRPLTAPEEIRLAQSVLDMKDVELRAKVDPIRKRATELLKNNRVRDYARLQHDKIVPIERKIVEISQRKVAVLNYKLDIESGRPLGTDARVGLVVTKAINLFPHKAFRGATAPQMTAWLDGR